MTNQNTPLFDRIALIGIGLIGSSLARALRKHHLAGHIAVQTRSTETLDKATGLKSVRWLQDKPHVNYLVALAAGHFKGLKDQYKNIPLGFYAPVSLFHLAKDSFKDTADMMASACSACSSFNPKSLANARAASRSIP